MAILMCLSRSLTILLVLPSLVSSFNASAVSVRSYAALGDSYAAGDGAGSSRLLPDVGCGRFSRAYPVQIADDVGLDVYCGTFKNLACGGASTSSVLRTQAPWIGCADIVTLTVGGNEVDFFLLLNECVHQWKPFSTCEAELAKARGLVQSTRFIDNFDRLIAGITRKLRPGAQLMVTGYAQFFNDITDQCGRISFSKTDPSNHLTKELRREFNQMVTMLNDVIKAAAAAHGALYVDMDMVFEGHRFCETGVVEPDPLRSDTWFFNLLYPDTDRISSVNYATKAKHQEPQASLLGPIRDFLDLTKVFHPTSDGHAAIAQEILRLISVAAAGEEVE